MINHQMKKTDGWTDKCLNFLPDTMTVYGDIQQHYKTTTTDHYYYYYYIIITEFLLQSHLTV